MAIKSAWGLSWRCRAACAAQLRPGGHRRLFRDVTPASFLLNAPILPFSSHSGLFLAEGQHLPGYPAFLIVGQKADPVPRGGWVWGPPEIFETICLGVGKILGLTAVVEQAGPGKKKPAPISSLLRAFSRVSLTLEPSAAFCMNCLPHHDLHPSPVFVLHPPAILFGQAWP